MSMRNLLYCLPILFATFMVQAQAEYKAHQDGWMVNLDKAYEESKRTGKPIMANFTGSDWCGWCKKLSAAVFNKDEFKTWASENVVLLELDYPRRFKVPSDIKKQNADLQQAFKVRGFPTIWVFDLDKDENNRYSINAMGKTGYKGTVREFTTDINDMIARSKRS